MNTDVTKTATGRQTAKLRIKLHDKLAALVSLAKLFGMLREGGITVVANAHDSVKMAMLS